jgi:hypothetical protein
LEAPVCIFHELDVVTVRILDPCLARVIHPHLYFANGQSSANELRSVFVESLDLEAKVLEVLVRFRGNDSGGSSPHFDGSCLVENLEKTRIAQGKITAENATIGEAKLEFYGEPKRFSVKRGHLLKAICVEAKMREADGHGSLLCVVCAEFIYSLEALPRQALLRDVALEFRAVFDVEFSVDMANVRFGSIFGDAQGVGDFLVRAPFGEERAHGKLATAQSFRVRADIRAIGGIGKP